MVSATSWYGTLEPIDEYAIYGQLRDMQFCMEFDYDDN